MVSTCRVLSFNCFNFCVVSLRLGFFHEAKEMRAACLRALRYYIQEAEDVDALIKLNIHFLIAR